MKRPSEAHLAIAQLHEADAADARNCYNTTQEQPAIDRRRPGAGYRHVLKKRDIQRFIRLLPDWNEPSIGVNVIQLAPGTPTFDGRHRSGVVAICAWDIDQAIEVSGSYYREHREIFERLGVRCTAAKAVKQ